MRGAENVGVRVSLRRDKLEARHLEQLTVRIAEVNGIHESAINRARVLDTEFPQTRRNLSVGGARDIERQVMQIPNPFRIWGWIIYPRGPNKERDQASIARIKIQMH